MPLGQWPGACEGPEEREERGNARPSLLNRHNHNGTKPLKPPNGMLACKTALAEAKRGASIQPHLDSRPPDEPKLSPADDRDGVCGCDRPAVEGGAAGAAGRGGARPSRVAAPAGETLDGRVGNVASGADSSSSILSCTGGRVPMAAAAARSEAACHSAASATPPMPSPPPNGTPVEDSAPAPRLSSPASLRRQRRWYTKTAAAAAQQSMGGDCYASNSSLTNNSHDNYHTD